MSWRGNHSAPLRAAIMKRIRRWACSKSLADFRAQIWNFKLLSQFTVPVLSSKLWTDRIFVKSGLEGPENHENDRGCVIWDKLACLFFSGFPRFSTIFVWYIFYSLPYTLEHAVQLRAYWFAMAVCQAYRAAQRSNWLDFFFKRELSGFLTPRIFCFAVSYRWKIECYRWSWSNREKSKIIGCFQRVFWTFKTAPLHLWMRKMDSWQNSTSTWLSKNFLKFFVFVKKIFFENEQKYFSKSNFQKSFFQNRFFKKYFFSTKKKVEKKKWFKFFPPFHK